MNGMMKCLVGMGLAVAVEQSGIFTCFPVGKRAESIAVGDFGLKEMTQRVEVARFQTAFFLFRRMM